MSGYETPLELWANEHTPGNESAKPVPDRAQSEILAKLNAQQKEAACATESALLIVAGAGTGKTRVLTCRIAHLLHENYANPHEILAITFTNKAAREMRERLQQMLSEEAANMWIGTFHSICLRILRAEGAHIGLPNSFTIYDTTDTKTVIRRILKNMGLDESELSAQQALYAISHCKNELIPYEECADRLRIAESKQEHAAAAYRLYQEELRRYASLDFDDIIFETVRLFREHPEILEKYRDKFRHIFVDEYQDTNHAQYVLLKLLTNHFSPAQEKDSLESGRDFPSASFTAVGDSDQSIYAFRGADISNIIGFEREAEHGRVIVLEQNYRSTQRVLNAANAIICENPDRHEKNLWTESGQGEKILFYGASSEYAEASFVIDQIEELLGEYRYSDYAILCRKNSQTRPFEETCTRRGIPYQLLGGTRFYDRQEIKDALAYCTVLVNQHDLVAFTRMLTTPKRGIGAVTIEKLRAYAQEKGCSLLEAMHEAQAAGCGGKAAKTLVDLAEKIQGFLDADCENISVFVSEFFQELGLTQHYSETTLARDSLHRGENLEEFLRALDEFQEQNPYGALVDFLEQIALLSSYDAGDDESSQVTIMTMHGSKGLEFPVVFLVGLAEGTMPGQKALANPGELEEERRLMYVAVTRARERLFLSYARQIMRYGKPEYTQPSRFLAAIDEEDMRREGAAAETRQWGAGVGRSHARTGSGWGGSEPEVSGDFWAHSSAESGRSTTNGNLDASLASWRKRRKKASGAPAPFGNRITTQDLKRNTGNMQNTVFRVGSRVRHKEYGEGQVIGTKGAGRKQMIRVRFADGQECSLVATLSPIENLDD